MCGQESDTNVAQLTLLYVEEPDDISGEIEGHVFNVQLSKAAKGFLEAERFFENPHSAEDDVSASD